MVSELLQFDEEQLAKVVNELPKKLLVFVTHHHMDHHDGELPLVQVYYYGCPFSPKDIILFPNRNVHPLYHLEVQSTWSS
jgi:phosphoribosyl 1,2-cyclic phosphodiesterase